MAIKTVDEWLLKKAYDSGKKLYPHYKEEYSGDAESNRKMELAFIWGLLGYPWDKAERFEIEKLVTR